MNTKRLFGIVTITLGVVFQIHAQDPFTNGLVAYYPFNENANDMSGNGNDGTVDGATLIEDRSGNPNSAYSFDGVDDQIEVANSASISPSNALTVAAWILPLAYEDDKHCVSKGMNENYTYRSYSLQGPWSDGTWHAVVSFAAGEVTTASSSMAALGQWSHVLMSYDGTAVNLYVNGQLSAAQPASGPINQTSWGLLIGSHHFDAGSPDYWFNGDIDDVRIYNRALPSNEVQQLYAFESQPIVSLKKAVKPSFSNLFLGTNYQLQVSTDLSNWTSHGSSFTPTNTIMDYPEYFDVDNWNQLFFRLQASP
ncbi:MAG: LamG domain-containing protein [Limisphaerales bacterium]